MWIEDGALVEFAEHAVPVITSGEYDLQIAVSASDGLDLICDPAGYEVVIVDIRLPPGYKPEWVDLFRRGGQNKAQARLGLELLYTCLGKSEAKLPSQPAPSWLRPYHLGVYTVETRRTLQPDLDRLGIGVFKQKLGSENDSDTVLLELISDVLKMQGEHRNGC